MILHYSQVKGEKGTLQGPKRIVDCGMYFYIFMLCPTSFFSNQIKIDQLEKNSVGQNMKSLYSHLPPPPPPPQINFVLTALLLTHPKVTTAALQSFKNDI